MSQLDVLSPDEFREKLKNCQKKEEEKGAAYKEFLSNCQALTLKANTILLREAEKICSGSVVSMERNYIGSAGLQAMTTLLSKNYNLRELRLAGNGIGNDAVVYLCRSMRNHPSLNLIDLSCNDSISLAGGLAILTLVQQNVGIKTILLEDCQVPLVVNAKIERCLKKNRSISFSKVSEDSSKVKPIFTSVDVLSERQKLREESRMDRWKSREASQLEALRVKVPEMIYEGFIPSPSLASGWRVIEVAILAPPGIFESERKALIDIVFPRLNAEMKSRRVLLLPMVNASESPPGVYLRQMRFSLACDLVSDISRSRFVTIELIGDRAGDYQQPSSKKMIDAALDASKVPTLTKNGALDSVVSAADPAAYPLHPVNYTAHQEMLKKSKWVIIATRRTTRRLGVPPSLAPLLSSEPPIEHPDKHKSLVKKVAVNTTLSQPNGTTTLTNTFKKGDLTTTVSAVVNEEPSTRISCSYETEQLKWEEHQAFKSDAIATAPVPELVVEDYHALFDSTSATGDIAIKGLDDFIDAIYQRLYILFTETFSVVESESENDFTGLLALKKIHASRLFQSRIDHSFCTQLAQQGAHKKTVTNRLNLYVATPPSRNSLVLHGTFNDVLAPLVSVCATRFLQSTSTHITAVHSTRYSSICNEPTDLRSVIFHLVSQLTSDPEVLRYMRNEVNLNKLKLFFNHFLSGGTRAAGQLMDEMPKVSAGTVTGDGSSPKTMVVIIDGVDLIDKAVDPCPALRLSEIGEDTWDSELPVALRETGTMVSYIPKCLARNVRLILTCNSSWSFIDRLRLRGRDSCDFIDIEETTANDIEVMLSPSVLAEQNVTLSDDEHALAQRKKDAGNPEYMRYLIDGIRQLGEVPSFQRQIDFISSFPETVSEAAALLYRRLNQAFGSSLVTKALGLLTASRWGLLLPDFRALMKLPPKRMNELLRFLRPVLETFSSREVGDTCGNVLHSVIKLGSLSFLQLLQLEKMQVEGAEKDIQLWHTFLAQHYHSIILGAANIEKTLIYKWEPSSPYELFAVKEFTYHATKAKMWNVIDTLILSPKFLMLVYRNGVAYSFLRDLILCFNERHVDQVLVKDWRSSSESTAEKSKSKFGGDLLPQAFKRMKDYIKFVKTESSILMEHPHLVLQIALEMSDSKENFVSSDALQFVKNFFFSYHGSSKATFFTTVEVKKKPKLHLGEISSVAFAWNRRHVITGGADRALSWVDPNTGQVPYQVHQSSARVRIVLYCSTSAYVAAMAVNRSVYIFDGAFGKLISKNDGDDFTSPVASFSFSSRGRYYLVGTEDLVVRVYDSEKGTLLFALNASDICAEDDLEGIHQTRNVMQILCNPTNDEIFYTVLNKRICVWRVVETHDGCTKQAVMDTSYVCGSPQWCWDPNVFADPSAVIQRSRYIIYQADKSTVMLTDLFNNQDVAKFSFIEGTSCGEGKPATLTKITLSLNHQLLAAATDKGLVLVFQIDWDFIRNVSEGYEMLSVSPIYVIRAFQDTEILDVAFRHDSASIFALGGERHLKYWTLSLSEGAANSKDETYRLLSTSDGDYVHREKVASMSVARLPEPGCAEVALGDVSGHLILLKLMTPSK